MDIAFELEELKMWAHYIYILSDENVYAGT